MNNDPTICAIATAQGGAIGIIRVSGNEAIEITEKIFSPAGKADRQLHDRAPYSIAFGRITDGKGETVDEVLVSVFRAPHSYTGEDSTEISCHGSAYILQRVMTLLIENGCAAAGPGEFTQRAFLNGKMDLSQAEAVADLISSTNKATHDMALSQLKGHFSNELSDLREHLLKLTSLLELELDFSDHEELEFADRSDLRALAEEIERRINTLAHSFETGNAIKQGVPVAIVGKTNVGKSTLLNRLLHEEKAIVSDIHGTTRDIIEDTIDIHGITFRFVDTAGLRATDDVIERIGIERSYSALSKAAIVLWVIDSRPTDDEIADITRRCEGKQLIVVINKTDKYEAPSLFLPFTTLSISALQGSGIATLKDTIYEKSDIPEIGENDAIITSARHYDSLLHAKESIDRVIEGLNMSIPNDLLSEDLRQCLDALAEITGGVITPSEVLNNIFSHFCIGK